MTALDSAFEPVTTPARGADRKPHKSVPQWMLLAYLHEVGPQPLPEIALVADISEHQARHKLDGLVQRGKARVRPGSPHGGPRVYEATGEWQPPVDLEAGCV